MAKVLLVTQFFCILLIIISLLYDVYH